MGGGEEAHDARGQALRQPSSEAERAIAELVLVFFQDRSRRALPAVLVNAGSQTLAVTAGPATIVPDGSTRAIDRAFVQIPGQAPLEAHFHEAEHG